MEDKKVEIRLNDRDYQAGDVLCFANEVGRYSFVITHVYSGLGMAEGYVALSVEHKKIGPKDSEIIDACFERLAELDANFDSSEFLDSIK